MDNQQIRLNKYLAERLGISRREADEAIASGKVTINGSVAKLGDKIGLTSMGGATLGTPFELDENGEKVATGPIEKTVIKYNGKIVPPQAEYLYLMFHKPVGYVCSRRAQGQAPTLYELLPKKYHHLKTVGRLDKDSSGLILLTNDGDFAFQMTHPKFRKTKVYEVELNRPLEPLHQQMISDYDVMLDDGPSQFKIIKSDLSQPLLRSVPKKTVGLNHYTVVLTEGRNRQIRRTFAALGYKVTMLHRTHFGKYELGNLAPEKYVIIEP